MRVVGINSPSSGARLTPDMEQLRSAALPEDASATGPVPGTAPARERIPGKVLRHLRSRVGWDRLQSAHPVSFYALLVCWLLITLAVVLLVPVYLHLRDSDADRFVPAWAPYLLTIPVGWATAAVARRVYGAQIEPSTRVATDEDASSGGLAFRDAVDDLQEQPPPPAGETTEAADEARSGRRLDAALARDRRHRQALQDRFQGWLNAAYACELFGEAICALGWKNFWRCIILGLVLAALSVRFHPLVNGAVLLILCMHASMIAIPVGWALHHSSHLVRKTLFRQARRSAIAVLNPAFRRR